MPAPGRDAQCPLLLRGAGRGPLFRPLCQSRKWVWGPQLCNRLGNGGWLWVRKSISGPLGSQEVHPQPGPLDILAHLCETVGQMVPPPEAPPHRCLGVLGGVPVHMWAGVGTSGPQGWRGCWGWGCCGSDLGHHMTGQVAALSETSRPSSGDPEVGPLPKPSQKPLEGRGQP